LSSGGSYRYAEQKRPTKGKKDKRKKLGRSQEVDLFLTSKVLEQGDEADLRKFYEKLKQVERKAQKDKRYVVRHVVRGKYLAPFQWMDAVLITQSGEGSPGEGRRTREDRIKM